MRDVPTPPRWPGAVRLGHHTYIRINDSNDLPVTSLVAEQFNPDQLLDLALCPDESYATLAREFYSTPVDDDYIAAYAAFGE